MTESDPASETSNNLNAPKTMGSVQHNIVMNNGYFTSRYRDGLRAGRPGLDAR
jgi:hypothetical protein